MSDCNTSTLSMNRIQARYLVWEKKLRKIAPITCSSIKSSKFRQIVRIETKLNPITVTSDKMQKQNNWIKYITSGCNANKHLSFQKFSFFDFVTSGFIN